MKALVTGGGGFLGGHIAHMLSVRGDDVTVLGRSKYPKLESAGIRTIQADVRDAQAVADSCRGYDIVYHVAGLPGIWGPRKLYQSINVDGTANVIRACRENRIAKLVHTSTPSVVFGTAQVSGIDESAPYATRFLTHYAAGKAAAEKMVLEANGANLMTVALRPHLIWGPGDPHLIPRVIDRARRKRLIQVGDGRNLVDITYVENAAQAHLLAADALAPGKPPAGKAYFISQGQPVVFWDWLREWLGRINAPPVRKSISFRAAFALGASLELIYRAAMIKREPLMTRFVATQLAKNHYFDISAARKDFGYVPRVSTEVGTDRLVEWILESGLAG
jgi:nucleoside-diphosphate-sugar epimerase